MSIKTMAAEDLALLSHEGTECLLEHKFFIVAKTLEGARFFSEDFIDFTEAEDAFDKYFSVVKYFSNYGSVTLYECNYDDAEIVKEEMIFSES